MKYKLSSILAAVSLFALTLAFAPAAVAAPVGPFAVTDLTVSDPSIAASATEAATTPALDVRGAYGLGFIVQFKLAGAGTENMVFKFDVSADGTTWTTNQPFSSGNIAATGATSVVAFINFTPVSSPPLANVRYIRLAKVTNGNATYALTVEKLVSSRFNR